MMKFSQIAMTGLVLASALGSQADAQQSVYPSNGTIYGQPYGPIYTQPDTGYSQPSYGRPTYPSNGTTYSRPYGVPYSDGSRYYNDRTRSYESYNQGYYDSRPSQTNQSSGHGAYGARSRVDQLAAELYEDANAICWEMYKHYQRNPNFGAVSREIYDIKEVARQMHSAIHQQNGRHPSVDSRIADALHDMDRRFHGFEADLSRWRPDSSYTPRRNLTEILEECERTLHAMMNDYGISTRYHEQAGSNRNDRRGHVQDRNHRLH